MGNSIVTFKIMPEGPDTNMEEVRDTCFKIGADKGAKGNMDAKIEPIAFGLKQLLVLGMFDMDDDFDAIAAEFEKIEGVNTAEVFKIDLAMG